MREALAILERAMALPLPEGPGSTLLRLRWRADQALLLETLGERDAARASYREALAGLLPALGTAHPLVTSLRLNYASFLLDEGRLEDAEAELSALDGALPPENPDRIAVAERLATIASERGLHEEAVRRSRAAVARAEQIYGPAHEETVSALLNLATRLERLPALDEAWQVLERASERARAAYAEDHPLRFRVDRERAAALRVRGRLAEAEAELDALSLRARERFGPQSPEALAIEIELLELRFESGERDALLAALDEALPRAEAVFGPGHARVFRLRLIAALAALRRDHRARPRPSSSGYGRRASQAAFRAAPEQLAVSAAAELAALERPEAARWAKQGDIAWNGAVTGADHRHHDPVAAHTERASHGAGIACPRSRPPRSPRASVPRPAQTSASSSWCGCSAAEGWARFTSRASGIRSARSRSS
ncbi:MAG: tetratricopeptide repeat protein [Xanthomonadales bacterium]|nr:tetratricopeptide repeat protein [Xanthomonadales bacterium]